MSPRQSSQVPAAPTQLTSSLLTRDSTAPVIPPLHAITNSAVRHSTNFPYRLSNTTKSLGELMRSDKAILLENALIDSSKPVDLAIPDALRAHGDPGSYIIQANGTITPTFRAQLKAAGLTIVSYIPNNAYLVEGTQEQVASFGSNAHPWEPYYKIQSSMMPSALAGRGARRCERRGISQCRRSHHDSLEQYGCHDRVAEPVAIRNGDEFAERKRPRGAGEPQRN